SYGGGGPLHTAGYTKGLGFEDILIPGWAAGFSAFGCGAADFEYRYDKTMDISVDSDKGEDETAILKAGMALQDAWDELIDKVAGEFEKNDYSPEDVDFRLLYRMKFQGQVKDIEIEVPIKKIKSVDDWNKLIEIFEEQYSRVYAQSALSPELGYAITGAIVRGIIEVPKPQIPEEPMSGETPPKEALLEKRQVYWDGEWIEANIYEMEKVLPGNRIGAFSILESTATTLVVPPGFEAILDKNRIFHLKEL